MRIKNSDFDMSMCSIKSSVDLLRDWSVILPWKQVSDISMVSFPRNLMLQKTKKNFNCVGQLHLVNEIRFWKKLPVKYSVDAAMRHQRKFMFISLVISSYLFRSQKTVCLFKQNIKKWCEEEKKTRKQIRTINGWVKHRNQKSCEFYRESNTSCTFNWAVIQFRA